MVSRACRNYQTIGAVSVQWKRPGQLRKFSPEVLDDLISPRALQDQKFLSLRERCDMAWEKHGVAISIGVLRRLYKRNGIGNRFSRPNVSAVSLDWVEWPHRGVLSSESTGFFAAIKFIPVDGLLFFLS